MNQPLQDLALLTAVCVDDSEFDRKLHDRVLKRSGAFAELLHFASGEAALDYLRATPKMPDVIFLDVHMPIMSGFDFLAAATQEFGHGFTSRVVIMLTTSLNPADRARAESFGVVRDYLNKPLTLQEAQRVADRTRIIVQGDR
ncbi:MAG: response regulator [Pseudomonadota bacterium]